MPWLRTFWSTVTITLRDLAFHYEVWIRYRNGTTELHGRFHSRTFADAIGSRLQTAPGNALAQVTVVRQRGVHPWTVRIIGFPLLFAAGLLEPLPVRVAITSVIAAVMLGAGAGGEKWIKGGPDDR